jgi:UDP-hydrolysing UDP-N-acetyl-D-glucosamine 2-epimerase
VKTLGVVTVARSDFGIWLPVLRAIQASPSLRSELYVSGMHLVPAFGDTVREVEASGFPVAERIDMLLGGDTAEAVSKSIGHGVVGFAAAFAQRPPDLLLVLGDRFEMYAAAVAALPFGLPMAHVHGGELTEGAMDDALRHSMTKLSHLHFVATEEYRRRVLQLGEEPWRVEVSGAPGLDNLAALKLPERNELETLIGMPLTEAPLLATFHPVTLELERTPHHLEQWLAALARCDRPIVFTAPNADMHGRLILERVRAFVQTHTKARLVLNLGTAAYFALMKHAAAMVGNSSSGLIEAPSFELPVVNVGSRQRGRVRAANVIDVPCEEPAITAALNEALTPTFRHKLAGLVNPYGDGHAAERIVRRLESLTIDERLLTKRFHDLPGAAL